MTSSTASIASNQRFVQIARMLCIQRNIPKKAVRKSNRKCQKLRDGAFCTKSSLYIPSFSFVAFWIHECPFSVFQSQFSTMNRPNERIFFGLREVNLSLDLLELTLY